MGREPLSFREAAPVGAKFFYWHPIQMVRIPTIGNRIEYSAIRAFLRLIEQYV